MLLTGWTPEQCFEFLDTLEKPAYNKTITDEDIRNMIRLKEDMTYKEIGEAYGLSESAAYKRIRRYKAKL